MATLTVWKFDSATGADDAVTTLQDLAKQELITVHDAATVSWPSGAKKPKTRSFTAVLLAFVTADLLWEGGQASANEKRPVYLAIAQTDTAMRPFLANLLAGEKAEIVDRIAFPPGKAGGLSEFAVIADADIGREFPGHLVTQPQAGIDLGETGADAAGLVRSTVEIKLDLGLQDQPVGDQEIMGCFGPRRQTAVEIEARRAAREPFRQQVEHHVAGPAVHG